MASEYALPLAGSYHHHGHSHSYSSIHLSPGKAAPNAFANSNGSFTKQAVTDSPLFTHAESSRETSPVPFANGGHSHKYSSPSLQQNAGPFQGYTRLSNHRHTYSTPTMKSRPRGESDLGRPANVGGSLYQPTMESIPAASKSWFSLPEALTSLLVTVPYVLASMANSATSGLPADTFPPLPAYAPSTQSALPETESMAPETFFRRYGFIDACILTSGTLMIVGIFGKLQSSERALDKGKAAVRPSVELRSLLNFSSLQTMALRALALGLPFYASTLIGGSRTGLVLLLAITANLTCTDIPGGPSFDQWQHLWKSKVATSVVLLLAFLTDEIGLTIQTSLTDLILGYLSLAASVLVLPPPLPTLAGNSAFKSTPKESSPLSRHRSNSIRPSAASPLTSSVADVNLTLASGVLLGMLTVIISMFLSTSPYVSTWSLMSITLSISAMASAILFSRPSTLRSQNKAGLALGCAITASCSFLFSPSLWPGTVCNGGLSALAFIGVLYDTDGNPFGKHDHDNVHTTGRHHDHHNHARTEGGHSALTRFIMGYCEPGSLVYSILSDKDSRRIAYFTALNFGFMIVQGAYGYLSGSLGLLSDTVHMFFDCLGLVVGLGAAVASKWPTSPEKPYGWGKLNTLAGFGNGIFLMLVSVEFVWEAIEGILEGRELRHVQELLVVSTLGLIVNLVGLFAFGHAHAGHDHGGHSHGDSHSHAHTEEHSHSHSHGQDHAHEHNHTHSNGHVLGHSHTNGHAHSHECSHGHEHKAQHSHGGHEHKASHSHGAHDHQHNENMHGIFLHVAADAGGSLAVIISTALTLWKPWYMWDPLATIIIAVLIFAAAVPLVTASGRKLLLVVPDDLEYNIKNALQELGELRGVVGYAVPRFWVDDKDEAGDGHGHHHHGHDHGSHGSKKVMGVIHVIASPSADLDDVRGRVEAFVAERNMDIVVHVERESEGLCWCGGGGGSSHSS